MEINLIISLKKPGIFKKAFLKNMICLVFLTKGHRIRQTVARMLFFRKKTGPIFSETLFKILGFFSKS